MHAPDLTVLWGADHGIEQPNGVDVISWRDLLERFRQQGIVRHLFRHREVELLVDRWEAMRQPLAGACAAWAMSRGGCSIRDGSGTRRRISLALLARLAAEYARDAVARPSMLRRVRRDLDGLNSLPQTAPQLDRTLPTVYLRTDRVFGLRSGGSVGHIAGVLNHLDESAGKPVLVTTDRIPTVREDIETHLIEFAPRFRDFRELPLVYSNRACLAAAEAALAGRKIAMVYQRYSQFNYAGLQLARFRDVPFVLEYNGSELWIARHWGTGRLRHEALAERIEMLNLRGADLVVVVSRPMRDELVQREVSGEKILVNPNGVDAEMYRPELDGRVVRQRYGLEGKLVIGFIGTFGPWHGAEVLVEAFGRMLRGNPRYGDSARLLLIGDGERMAQVRAAIAKYHLDEPCVLAGRVPQSEGPEHLAACDVLASPHVPNRDGTPFFGSPTKLFEYMAMGRAIVASELDQIGEVLCHDRTAWLVRPGDASELADGLGRLLDDPALRERLGRAARDEVVAHYTWKEHTRRIVEALAGRRGKRASPLSGSM